VDPFRNELAAAHAKIATLEERVKHLEHHGHASRRKRRFPRSMIVYFLFSILIFVVLGAVTIGAFMALTNRGARSTNGVAKVAP
jgi:hypothetical protein